MEQRFQIIYKNVNDLILYEKNAKEHTEKQIKAVAESIKRFGFVQPVVVDSKNNVIIGHCRIKASILLGMQEVPTIIADQLSDDEVKALRLADNKLNESAWNIDLVVEEIKLLDDNLINLTGFDKSIIELKEEDDVDLGVERIFQVVVSAKDELEQQEIYEKLVSDGYDVKVITI